VLPELRDIWVEEGFKVPHYPSNADLIALERNPEWRTYQDTCPTCDGTGKYMHRGEEYVCEVDAYGDAQHRLARHYMAHNVPMKYQQLDWDWWSTKTKQKKEAKIAVDRYVDRFKGGRTVGAGLTLRSERLGTGKTMAATRVLMEVLKMGYGGWYAAFEDVKGYFEHPDPEVRLFLETQVKESPLLVLDDVLRPTMGDKQRNLFSSKLEAVIRPRHAASFPTIITTNMGEEELETQYPRVHSLLMGTNEDLFLDDADDYRKGGEVWERLKAVSDDGERNPIT